MLFDISFRLYDIVLLPKKSINISLFQFDELRMFLLVLIVFLLAYGVASQSLLYRQRESSWDILRDVVFFPYWQLYGELDFESAVFSKHFNTPLFTSSNTCKVDASALFLKRRLIVWLYSVLRCMGNISAI